MNIIDIVFIVPLIWFGYKGFNKGLVIEIASLIGLILGIYIAVNFSWFIGNLIRDNVKMEDNVISLVAFGITFVGVILGVRLIAKAVEKVVKIAMLGFVNKLGGALFGALKIAFIISVILYFYHRIDPKMKIIPLDSRENSLLYQPVANFAPAVIPKLVAEKERLQDRFRDDENNGIPQGSDADTSGVH